MYVFLIHVTVRVLIEWQALDKGNLGNAKTDGMDKDLGFKGNQYNIMLSIFYVPYVIFAPPIGMLGKKYGPHRVLPILMFCFGSATLLAASVKNWSGMMALRWFLGMFNFPRRDWEDPVQGPVELSD
jgi:MFS family permease